MMRLALLLAELAAVAAFFTSLWWGLVVMAALLSPGL